ncbi:DUF2474 domain-containing protein (plasmid) [Rhizobium gallicum]|nr:DUF2474 domain-containing protein [Rhizobium gallicum]ULJ76701.1 DUF2474 domain-containing protein [Rhizobium gallicum]
MAKIRQIGWMGLIWMASVLALGAFALMFRGIMSFAGMTS